jgi:hypothetical protein
MKWLGAAFELLSLRSRPSHTLQWDGRATFVLDWQLDSYFTNRSVPQPIRVRHSLGELHLALCAIVGERPAAGRAATTRHAPCLFTVPQLQRPTVVAVLWRKLLPAWLTLATANKRLEFTLRCAVCDAPDLRVLPLSTSACGI